MKIGSKIYCVYGFEYCTDGESLIGLYSSHKFAEIALEVYKNDSSKYSYNDYEIRERSLDMPIA